MINTFQLIAFIPLLSLRMPAFLQAFCNEINNFNLQLFDALQAKMAENMDLHEKSVQPQNVYYVVAGFEYSSFLINVADAAILFCASVLSCFLVLFLRKTVCKSSNGKIAKKMDAYTEEFSFNFFVRYIQETFLIVVIACLINISLMENPQTNLEIATQFIVFCMLTLYIAVPLYFSHKLLKSSA